MTRRIILSATLAIGAIVAACGEGAGAGGSTPAPVSAWREPPALTTVRRSPQEVVISGTAAPGARVVLIAPEGPAYAGAVDSQGRFDLHLTPPTQPELFQAEVQSGAQAAAAPGLLLVAPAAMGVAAVLTPGQATRVLEGGGLISAADYDGRTLLINGRAQAGASVSVTLQPGGRVANAVADSGGRYQMTVPNVPPGDLRLEGTAGTQTTVVSLNLDMSPQAGLAAVVGPQGLTVQWSLPGGGLQLTWIAASSAP